MISMWPEANDFNVGTNVGTHPVPMIVGFEDVKKEKTVIFCDVVRMDG